MIKSFRAALLASTFTAVLAGSTLVALAVTVDETVAWLGANGYTVLEVEVSRDGATFEIKALFDGAPVQLYVDAETGVISTNDDGVDDPSGDSADDPSGDSADDPSGDGVDDPSGDSVDDPSDDSSDDSVDDPSDDSSDSSSDDAGDSSPSDAPAPLP